MPPRVLVADPNERDREASRDSLTPLGYDVTCVDSAEAALEERESRPPDVVILDETLRYAGGKDVAAGLKAGGFLPVVLAVSDVAASSTYKGVDGAISKPPERSALQAMVRCTLQFKDLLEGLQQHNERLEQLLAEKRGLFDFLNHDLNGHLQNLAFNLSYLRGALGRLESEKAESLEACDEATQKMSEMVRDMLILARSEEVGLELQPTRVDLQDLVAHTFDQYRRQADLGRVHMRCLVPADLTVEADKGMLERVMFNLMANALRHAGQEGDVLVSAKEAGPEVEIVVSNTGLPLGEAIREHMFEKFVTGPRDSDSKRTGVGLYFCWRVVRAHGGTIWVEDRPGYAVSVVVRLPRRAAKRAHLRACPTDRPGRPDQTRKRDREG